MDRPHSPHMGVAYPAALLTTSTTELEPLSDEHAPLFADAFASLRAPLSDYSFANCLAWSEPLDLRVGEIEGHLCVFSGAEGDLTMLLPPLALATGDVHRIGDALEACLSIMDEANTPHAGVEASRIEYVSDEVLERIRSHATPPLSAGPMPGDYVYDRCAMVELSGGPLKGKRKLRSRFLRDNEGRISTGPIRASDLDACAALLRLWRCHADEKHEGEANDALVGVDVLRLKDQRSTLRALSLIEPLGLPSLLVRVDGRLVGFTIGERLTRSMGVVSVEKTHPDFVGTPQFIFSEFCTTCFEECTEINVCDDWGIASLRFTKMSYRPTRMLSKSVLTRTPVVRNPAGGPEPSTVRLLTLGRPASRIDDQSLTPARAHVRRATLDDIDAICAVEQRAFVDPTDRFTRRQIRRLVSNPRAHMAVTVVDGTIAGWSVALVRSHVRTRSGRVYSVAVDPNFSGRGLGRGLLRWSLETLARAGIGRVYLEVRATNQAAISLYESEGFSVVAKLPAYYGDGADGLRMRRVCVCPVATN